jgi:spore maturation protein CgeB
MKTMIVGVFNENSTNNGIANGFSKITDDRDFTILYNYRQRAKAVGAINRDAEIIATCERERPDLVFFCKCNGVHVRVLHECNKYSKTFLWYMDPLNGNYNEELKQKIKAATASGIAKYEVYLLALKINPNSHFLIEGYDPSWDFPMELPKIHDVSFIGNLYGDRRKWLATPMTGTTIIFKAYNTEHAKVVSQSKINLNFTGAGGPSDRAYKILAAKGFLLSQNYPHMDKYGLTPGKDFIIFNTQEELIRLKNYYLEHEKERNQIAEHGYKTVQKFSRDNLAKEVVKILT